MLNVVFTASKYAKIHPVSKKNHVVNNKINIFCLLYFKFVMNNMCRKNIKYSIYVMFFYVNSRYN